MKKYLILLLGLLSMTDIFAQQSDKQDKVWCRPISNKQSEYDCQTTSGKNIKMFRGELVITKAEKNGDIILGNDTLSTDAYGVADSKQKVLQDLDSVKLTIGDGKDLEIKIFKDTLYLSFNHELKGDSFYVINQTKNKIIKEDEASDIVKINISTCSFNSDTIRVALFGKLSSVIPLESIDTISPEVLTENSIRYRDYSFKGQIIFREEIKEEQVQSSSMNIYIIIGGVVLAVVVLVVVVFYFINRQKSSDENENKDNNYEKQTEQPVPNPEIKELTKTPEDRIKELEKQINDNDRELSKLNSVISSLTPYKEKFESKVEDIKQEAKEKEERIRRKADQEIEDVKEHSRRMIANAERERDEAKAKTKTIRDELNASFDQEKKKMLAKQDELSKDLTDTKSKLKATSEELRSTANNLNVSNEKIVRLEQAQVKYSSVLTYVPFAESYSKIINDLFKISEKINKSASDLMKVEVDDPWHLMKCVAKYNKSISEIDMASFYTDVNMISQGQMVLKGSTLASYNQDGDKQKLNSSMKMYFFDNYLSKYIDALIVFNESLAGLNKLIPEFSNSTKVYSDYREQINNIIKQLEITVESVKLFDKVGQKIDLRVTLVDAGFSTGDILEIDNCIVYLNGFVKPSTKIIVKAQE